MERVLVQEAPPVEQQAPPPLRGGDRLSRAEFARRYRQHPEIKKAELVEGVVYVPSPIRHEDHGRPHAMMAVWLGTYWSATAGSDMSDNASVRLDFENEVQPDLLLRLESALGGNSGLTSDGYLEGAPEFIVEIAASSASYDMHDKRRVYARNGVQEYLVVQMYEQRMDWFRLREGVYAALPADEQGILRSEIFPGLWLDTAAFWRDDLTRILATLRQGLQSPDHAAFVARLQSPAGAAQ